VSGTNERSVPHLSGKMTALVLETLAEGK